MRFFASRLEATSSHRSRLLFALATLLGLISSGIATLPAADGTRDLGLTLRARQVLVEEPGLASHQLGVTVQEGVATLWGTLPNLELARRAEERVRQILGVTRVDNRLRVAPPEPKPPDPLPLATFRQKFMQSASDGSEPAHLGASLAGRIEVDAHARQDGLLSRVTEAHKPAQAGSGDSPRLGFEPETARSPGRVLHLGDEVEAICRRDVRWSGIRPAAVAGVVYLSGFVDRWEDLFVLAREVAQLPGVERVILKNIRSESSFIRR